MEMERGCRERATVVLTVNKVKYYEACCALEIMFLPEWKGIYAYMYIYTICSRATMPAAYTYTCDNNGTGKKE